MWPQQLSVLRSNYTTDDEYLQELADARKHYDYEVAVEGGYKFFEFYTDYETWTRQK